MALFTPTTYWGGAAGPPPAFNPNFLGTSLHHWLSMNAGSIGTNSSITSVSDLGSYSNSWDIGGGTGTSYAQRQTTSAITYNGSNAAYASFDGSADYWDTGNVVDNLTDTSGNTYIVVLCYITTNDKFSSIVSLQATRDFQAESTSGTSWQGNIDLDGLSSSGGVPWYSDNGTTRNYTFQWNIFAFVFNKTGNQIYGRINGYPMTNSVSYSNSITTGVFRVATNRGGNRRLRMNMAEMLVVKGKPGTSTNTSMENLQKVEGWMAWTYGQQGRLPSTHPYKNSAP
jgi:hypothetical protein